MDWRHAASERRYRVVGSREVAVGLESGASVLAQSTRLVYCSGAADWSFAAGDRGITGMWLGRAERRAAGSDARVVSRVLWARRPLVPEQVSTAADARSEGGATGLPVARARWRGG